MPRDNNSIEPAAGDRSSSLNPEIFSRTYLRILETAAVPRFEIQLYPYRSIKNTLRIRDGAIRVRISHMLHDAPDEIMEAVYEILLCKTYRMRGYDRASLIYNRYLASPEFQDNCPAGESRDSRIKKLGTEGRTADLGQRFQLLNNRYFEGLLRNLKLNWADRKSRKILGQFIPHHDEILINSMLDHPLVPLSVIDYVLYHEMLHAFLEPRISSSGRKIFHNREFKKMERDFEFYKFATEFIEENF